MVYSFASKILRIKCWKYYLAGSTGHGAGAGLGWCICSVQHQGAQPWLAQRTLLSSVWWCILCCAPLPAGQVALHLALRYRFMFIEVKRKGFLPARLTLWTVLSPVLLFWWVMWGYMFSSAVSCQCHRCCSPVFPDIRQRCSRSRSSLTCLQSSSGGDSHLAFGWNELN